MHGKGGGQRSPPWRRRNGPSAPRAWRRPARARPVPRGLAGSGSPWRPPLYDSLPKWGGSPWKAMGVGPRKEDAERWPSAPAATRRGRQGLLHPPHYGDDGARRRIPMPSTKAAARKWARDVHASDVHEVRQVATVPDAGLIRSSRGFVAGNSGMRLVTHSERGGGHSARGRRLAQQPSARPFSCSVGGGVGNCINMWSLASLK